MKDMNERAESLLRRLEEKKRAALNELETLWKEGRQGDAEFGLAALRCMRMRNRIRRVHWALNKAGKPRQLNAEDWRKSLKAMVSDLVPLDLMKDIEIERGGFREDGSWSDDLLTAKLRLSETIQLDAKFTK